ncbi:E3 ubiquitin-protein ligase mib1-like isoform X1 [Mercenaria mercenaria]|uniref:E3 ubiquitin-protein ligase mib1-like isoform X1 n=3 Tax=Mercenaria mercenaria TaxID=6596 RepID=UPI00234F46C9|nr:E3 ubiquitin-protein ligase mib1-like isoform X1 [Mercenaria mercenaria]
MAMIRSGIRVIQGPDWQSRRQDGGLGHAGTIIYVPKEGSSDDKVTVIWDNGRELRYRAGKDGKYDLRVLDNAPVGVRHTGITCDVCQETPIIGFRWKCSSCDDYDLCTPCYMSGKHDISHSFLRMDVENIGAVPVSPRRYAKPKDIQGVFKGATVMRGPHWKWKNDDGGGADDGEVLDIVSWQGSSPRGGVKVKWRATKKEGTYRMGGDGCVDVIYTEEATFGKYYIEHLPLVDIVNPGEVILKNSDKVRVSLDKDHFKRLQEHEAYGGWSDKMMQCINEVGTVVKMLYDGKAARVQYTDGQTWTLNRQALYRLHSFSPGEVITILEDDNTVRELQEGHGGWNDEMKSTLGAIGRIARIDSDGDIRVKVGDRVWIYSPVCCCPLEDQSLSKKAPDLTKSEMEHGEVDDLKQMQRDMERVAGALADLFVGLLRGVPDDDSGDMSVVEAAAKGDIGRVKDIVRRSPDKVNAKHENKTALQLACYEGKMDVIKFLLDNKADVNISDDEGDTALHYAAFGQEEGALGLLLQKGAKLDMQNKKGQTSLHITVGKGSVPCTRLLIKHGASVNLRDEDGDSPMHDCIIQRRKQNYLIDAIFKSPRPDFTVSNGKGFNVLQWAALKDCRRAAEIIISNKSSVIDLKMPEGFTALHICAANDHVEIASGLLKAGANKDARDGSGRTPLIVAVSQSHKRTVELLLTYDCKVDAQDNEGNTALHVAQISRALPDTLARLLGVPLVNDDTGIQISCMLVEARASISITNKKGQTPIDMCTDVATKEFLKRLAKTTSTKKLETSQRGVVLPTHWDQMDRSVLMKRIPLDITNGLLQKEFQGVKNKFCRTLPQARIITIERVQNKFLWEHYFFKRTQMETLYGKGCANELDLYHGTEGDKVDLICNSNLDHRLAGEKVGTLFGQGSYFASDAKYSDGYASADTNGHKYMFQCRVLAGKWTHGDPKYKRPPPVNDKDPSRLYDCCVDSTDRPRIFCLFDMNQYYPEYVIKYQ